MGMNFHEGKDNELTAQSKGSDRIQINNILAAISVTILAILAGAMDKVHPVAIYGLVVAVPLLVTSSLAYTKLSYRKGEYEAWNGLGWWTHTLGYFIVIGSISVHLASQGERMVASSLLLANFALVVVYSIVDVNATKVAKTRQLRMKEKVLKGLVIAVVLGFAGAVIYNLPGVADSAQNQPGPVQGTTVHSSQ